MRSNEAQIPKNVSRYYKMLDSSYQNRHKEIINVIKMLLTGSAFKNSSIAFKKNKKPLRTKESILTNLEYFLFRRSLEKQNRAMQRYYKKHSVTPDFSKNFIYFAAPYQPEVLSNLFAGVYEDVFLVLDIITSVIPKDWKILYKEHPNTFKVSDKGVLERSKDFYDRLLEYESLELVEADFSTFTLVDHSSAVCTIGGTVGWEAIIRGKPALVFGSLWYQSCESVFTIKSLEDAQEAIKKIVNGFTPDKNDVEKYAQAIYQVTNKILVSPSFFRKHILSTDAEKAMEATAEAFNLAYHDYYSDC